MAQATPDVVAINLAPVTGDAGDGTGNAVAPRLPQLLAGVGVAEAQNSVAMRVGAKATLRVGAASIRLTFRQATGVAAAVALTDMLLPAGEEYSWWVQDVSKFVYCEAGDAVAAYQAYVWQSSP